MESNLAPITHPAEHYIWWRKQIQDVELHHQNFGEHLTTEGC